MEGEVGAQNGVEMVVEHQDESEGVNDALVRLDHEFDLLEGYGGHGLQRGP